jgi:hypothetical protein
MNLFLKKTLHSKNFQNYIDAVSGLKAYVGVLLVIDIVLKFNQK